MLMFICKYLPSVLCLNISAWPDQSQYPYQPHNVPSGPRMPIKSHLNPPEVKQNPDSPRMRKPWLNSRDTSQIPNKPQNVPSAPAQSQSSPAAATTKSQVFIALQFFVTFIVSNAICILLIN